MEKITVEAAHCSFWLAPHVRQEAHIARSFDGLGKLSLMLGADAGVLRVDYFHLA